MYRRPRVARAGQASIGSSKPDSRKVEESSPEQPHADPIGWSITGKASIAPASRCRVASHNFAINRLMEDVARGTTRYVCRDAVHMVY